MQPHFPVPDRPRRSRVRSLMLVVAASALVAWLACDPLFWVFMAVFVAVPLLILGLMIGLCAIGFAGWAVAERCAGWVRRSASFADESTGA